MAKKGRVEVNIDKLVEFAESLKTRPVIQVGVFSKNNARKDTMTNATLAAIHELGDMRHSLPARSMLQVPLKDHAKKIMAAMKDKAHELVEKGRMMQAWKLLGIAAEKVVLGAFKTGGYGKWAHLQDSTLLAKLKGSLKKRKGTLAKIHEGQAGEGILIDSRQLERAFSSRVIKRL